MGRNRLGVFISSSMVELRDERVTVNKVLEERGFEVFLFEYDAGARPEPIQRTYLDEVEASDLYLGIFWNHYGPSTVEEFRHARRLNKPCLIYIKNYDVHREPELVAFLTEITDVESGVSYCYFEDVVQLAEFVGRDVQAWLVNQLRQAQKDLAQAQKDLETLRAEKKATDSEKAALERRIAALEAEVEMLTRARDRQPSESSRLATEVQRLVETLGYKIIERKFIDSHRVDLLLGIEDARRNITIELIVCTDRSIMPLEVKEILRNRERRAFANVTIISSQEQIQSGIFGSTIAEGIQALTVEEFMSRRLELRKPGETTLWELVDQGRRAFYQGDFSRAIFWFDLAASHARQESNADLELQALSWLSVAWGNTGNAQKMIEFATRLLARARQVSSEKYQMVAALRLANALAEIDLRGRWNELRPLLLEGLDAAHRLGDEFYEVYHLVLMGEYAIQMGEDESGFRWLQQALDTLQPSTEHRNYFSYRVYRALSWLMQCRHDHHKALRYAEMAIDAAQKDGNPQFIADAQLTLVRAKQALREPPEALELVVEEVLSKARQMGWKGKEQVAEYLRSELLREMGHPEQAEPSARRALELAREMKLKEQEVECLLSLGQVLLALKRPQEAREVLQQARRLSQERDYADHFQRADELLRGE
jgi:tetratricopeptide (TPR) repeat protein